MCESFLEYIVYLDQSMYIDILEIKYFNVRSQAKYKQMGQQKQRQRKRNTRQTIIHYLPILKITSNLV